MGEIVFILAEDDYADPNFSKIILSVVIGGMVVVGFFVAGFIYPGYEARKRKKELAAFADEHGFAFFPDKADLSFPFSLFQAGRSRWSRFRCAGTRKNAIGGLPGVHSFDLFEYHYAIGGNGGDNHYHFCCLTINTRVDLGHVFVRGESLEDKVAAVGGFDDIDFEDPDFSNAFFVRSSDRRLAYEIFYPRMMTYMLANKGWFIETYGPLLMLWKPGRPRAADYAAMLSFVEGFLGRLPRTIVNRERERLGMPAAMEAGDGGRNPPA